jgi:hypothetical protein
VKLAKVPKVGDILKFKSNYIFNRNMNYFPQGNLTTPTITTTGTFYNNSNYLEIQKDTLVEVVEVSFTQTQSGMSDEVNMSLIVAVEVEGQPEFFKFDYSVHKHSIEVIEASKALKVLYGDK